MAKTLQFPAVEVNDAYLNQLLIVAIAFEEDKDFKKAKMHYELMLKLRPGYSKALINLGTLYYNARDYKAAFKYYDQATKSDPDYALAWFDLGTVCDDLKMSETAIKAYLKAIQLKPDYADAHYNVAMAYNRKKMTRRKALRHLQMYCRYAPSDRSDKVARNHIAARLKESKLHLVPSASLA